MFKWILRAVIAGAVFGAVLALSIGIGAILKTSDIFTVDVVEVRGVSHTDREMLKTIYQPFVGRNIFQEISPNRLLTDDPWVVRLEMKRVVPNKLVVIVREEQELISYKQGAICTAVTALGNKIPVGCANVNIKVAEFPFPEEFKEFTALYNKNEMLQKCDITLKNGFFIAACEGGAFVGTYAPGVFEDNLDTFISQIKDRYKAIDRVDLTVRGKVYVKGVTHG